MPAPSIKPSHKGLFHEDLGIPEGQPIPLSRIMRSKKDRSPAIRKRANFALMAKRHWKPLHKKN